MTLINWLKITNFAACYIYMNESLCNKYDHKAKLYLTMNVTYNYASTSVFIQGLCPILALSEFRPNLKCTSFTD